jgi:predicted unusual protein kinase regulating ubiquinone biosynthesis (AarF/ABC1/UbiB family)
MRSLSKYLDKNVLKYFNISKLVDELEEMIHKELDFEEELKNIEKLRAKLIDDNDIVIPKAYKQFTTKKILTMEYIDGIKITNIEKIEKNGLDKKDIIKRLINNIFKQVFVYGIHHGDPHPANIFVLKDGRIAFLDFGVIGYLDDRIREILKEQIVALYQGKSEEFLRAYMRLNDIDLDSIENSEQLREEVEKTVGEYKSGKILSYTDLLDKVVEILNKYKISINNPLTILTRTMVSVNSICARYGLANEEFMNIIKSGLEEHERYYLTKKIMEVFSIDNFFNNIFAIDSFIKNTLDKIPPLLDNLQDIDYDEKMDNIDNNLKKVKHNFSFFIIFILMVFSALFIRISSFNPVIYIYTLSDYILGLTIISTIIYLIRNR